MRVVVFLSLALAPFVGAGCTFLVSFDDAPGGACDGGVCIDATALDDAAASDARDADPASDAAAADTGSDVVYTPCKGLASGLYCATDHLGPYPGPMSDLVTCDAGGVWKVRHCGDAGCVSMADPFADTCNECPTKANGTYCGRDFAAFPAEDSDILIGCQGGNVVQDYLCPHGCKSNGTAASCYP